MRIPPDKSEVPLSRLNGTTGASTRPLSAWPVAIVVVLLGASPCLGQSDKGVSPEIVKAFAGKWTGKSHASGAIVGSLSVLLDGHPRLMFANGDSLDVAVETFGSSGLLLQVRVPQRLPETQPPSVDPEPVYWLVLLSVPADEFDDRSAEYLDMVVFLTPTRPTGGAPADSLCPDDQFDRTCRVFDFRRVVR